MLKRTTVAVVAAALVAAVLTPASGAQAQVPVTQVPVQAAQETPDVAIAATAKVSAAATYTIVSGDTLSTIASRHGTTWQNLWEANSFITNPNLIYPGQVLTIDGSSRQAPAAAPAAPAPAATGWVNPAPGVCITDTYGWHNWRGYVHQGTDIGSGQGAAIRAAAGGQVTRAGWIWSGYGISVTINHDGGITTHYAHLSGVNVSVGQWVGAGAVIGYAGSTGQVTGPHLHFEVATSAGVLGSQINPEPFMADRGVYLGC